MPARRPRTMPKLVRRDDAPPLLDSETLYVEMRDTIEEAGSYDDAHARLIPIVKAAVVHILQTAEALLLEDRGGLACAQRLSLAEDTLIKTLYRVVTEYRYPLVNPSQGERITVCAVGGYGRGTLGPQSDIDLLFLRPAKQTPWGEQVVESLLYFLWDCGFKVGHATRTVDECVKLAKTDMTIRTALLETRFILGDQPLFETFQTAFQDQVVKGSAAEFVSAKLGERDGRHKKQGSSRYVVEPNVKESKGGLRDLNTLFWIGKYVYQVDTEAELVTKGVFTRREYNAFVKGSDFLWATRCHIHFLMRRPDDRLSFDLQGDIAQRLGYTDHPGMQPVERFMKHYFLVAKDVGDLTRILCARLEENEAKQTPILDRMLGPLRRRNVKKLPANSDFVVDTSRLNVARETVFSEDPVNLLRFFQLADKYGLALHPDATRLVTLSLKLVTPALKTDPDANAIFLEIICSKNRPEATLRRMNETGFLGRFVPDFGKVVAMMQFNMYHHYTVDEHLLRTVGVLAQIETGHLKEEHPLSVVLLPTIQNRRALYVALFLHDIAKGRPQDHSTEGAKIARRLCPRFGLSPSETALVAWLIEDHLVMSMTAQSRDLSDPTTIETFAARVQTLERLKLLLILTVCDIRAVGPGVWNGWKGQLLRTLYYETEIILTGGHSEGAREQRVAGAQSMLFEALPDWSEDERKTYAAMHYAPYWLRTDLDRKIAHAHLIKDADEAGKAFASLSAVHSFEGVTEIVLYTPDHPRLLSTIAAACVAAKADIVGAQIHTTSTGKALDTILIRQEFEQEADERRRADRIAATLESAMTGDVHLPPMMAEKGKAKGRVRAFKVPAEVMIDNQGSERFTVIEAAGRDRPGLLHDLASALSDLSLDTHSAHVATFGERAVDVFYVTDLMGQKVTSRAKLNTIKQRLEEVLGGTPAKPRPAALARRGRGNTAVPESSEHAPSTPAPRPARRSKSKART
ncbi:[protein-PII] uridylyltransferase [Ahrensia marina]|uniref:[protein-PII] uridylyltransferase n=2 Tax=Ahrensia marina TaxID=1514904 RepID=UPI0035CE8681